MLAPYKSKQQEAGVKVDWGTITTTAAVFEITLPSVIRTASNELAYDGEQRNRGVELSVYGLLLPGLRGMASAMFLRPELTNPANPLERGNDAPGVPDKTFSAGLDWDIPWLTGLAVNGRVIYTSGSYLTGAQLAPAVRRLDACRHRRTLYDGDQRHARHVPRQHRKPVRRDLLAHDRHIRDGGVASNLPRICRIHVLTDELSRGRTAYSGSK